MKKSIWSIVIILIVIILLIGGIFKWIGNAPIAMTGDTASTTIEATTTLKTFTDPQNNISFKYSAHHSCKYMGFIDWPPQLSLFKDKLSCSQATTTPNGLPGTTVSRTINGRVYCVTEFDEGAAGSIYKNYDYKTVVGGQGMEFSWSMRISQCMNYEEPQQSECKSEEAAFNPDVLMDNITQTIVIH